MLRGRSSLLLLLATHIEFVVIVFVFVDMCEPLLVYLTSRLYGCHRLVNCNTRYDVHARV